jgi:alanine-glyoxylate transaminase/serine-glyoxylate transaminase/serine-pyruvate transaminase
MYVIAQHTPATVHVVQAPYGKPVDPEDVRKVAKGRKIKMIGLAQGETSSGVLTDIDPFRKVADEFGSLLVVDTVASLAAVPLHVDKQRIDICFSGSQKAISAPPGMSPITVSPRAEEAFRNRKSKVQSWYFDLSTAMNYWGKDRLYHHTPPISLIYALREAMRIVLEEGLEARWAKHKLNQQALVAGVEALGLKLLVENPKDRLVTVTAVMIPSGVNDAKFRNQLLDEFNIEIAGPPQRQDLAPGLDGLLQPEAFRAATPRRHGKVARRPGAPRFAGSRRRRGPGRLHQGRNSGPRRPLA